MKWVNVMSCHVINEDWEDNSCFISCPIEKINVPISTTSKKILKSFHPLPGEKK